MAGSGGLHCCSGQMMDFVPDGRIVEGCKTREEYA